MGSDTPAKSDERYSCVVGEVGYSSFPLGVQ